MKYLEELKKVLGDYLITDPVAKLPYYRDASYLKGNEPSAVAIPENTEQLQEVMRICFENDVQITARGGGTSLTGSSIPSENSIVLSFARMNRIIEINTADRYAYAEAGVRLDDLNSALSKLNFMYPPDPGSSIAATVGGSLSTNAGGLRAVQYGTTKEWVLGLELVLSDGTLIHTGGRVLKRSEGYDLTALIIGSEGTLALITKAFLKITPKPERIGRIIAYYNEVAGISSAISVLKSNGVTPLTAEFMDRVAMNSIQKTSTFRFPEEARYMVMIDLSSTRESLDRVMRESYELLRSTGPTSISMTTDENEILLLSKMRKGLYSSELSERKSSDEMIITGDIAVPSSRLPAAMKELEKARGSLNISFFGHIGDGNIHANIFFDTSSFERAQEYLRLMGEIAVKYDGSVSAEHGIGLEKKELFVEELRARGSLRALDIMKGIKKIMDPKGILNGGKIF